MRKMNCIVIDDEPLACKGLEEYIEDIDGLSLYGVFNSPLDAMGIIDNVDLIYLDVNMPKLSGIDFLRQLRNPPLVIITTAFKQYALEGYELNVVDFLLKPISFERFLKATTKAIDYFRLKQASGSAVAATNTAGYFFVKSNGILEKIAISEIAAVESLSNYVRIHLQHKVIVAYLTLKQVEEYLPDTAFVKVHKSFIVAIDKIEKMSPEEIYIAKLSIPVGNNYKKEVIEKITNGKILKR